MGPTCAKIIALTPPVWTLDPCCHVVYTKLRPFNLWMYVKHLKQPVTAFPVLFRWAYANFSLSFRLLLPYPICFRVWPVVRGGLLHTLVVTSGFVSYCCPSIISNESGYSPPTCGIKKAFFCPWELPLAGYFLIFGAFTVNPRGGCVWKSQYLSSFWNTKSSQSGNNNPA